jgi:hypothetical protein
MKKALTALTLCGAMAAYRQAPAARASASVSKVTIQNIISESLANCNEKTARTSYNDLRYGNAPGQYTGVTNLAIGENQNLLLATLKRADGIEIQMYGATSSKGSNTYCSIPEKHQETVGKYFMQLSPTVKAVTFTN